MYVHAPHACGGQKRAVNLLEAQGWKIVGPCVGAGDQIIFLYKSSKR